MRHLLVRFLAAAAAVIMPAAASLAQSTSPDVLVPQRHRVRPGVVAVEGVDVQVEVSDRVATTRMAVTLHNPTGSAREAQLVLPVPTGSAIRSFGVDAISAEPNAVLLPREEATRVYRDIVAKLVDPGLLEFVGTDLIRSSVFPVPAGEQATFRIVYEHALHAESGRFEYVLPRSESLAASGVAWTIGLDLRTSRDIGLIYSPTHALEEQEISSDHTAVRVLEASEPGPFRMYFVLAGEGGAGMTTLLYPDPKVGGGKGGYFMLFLDAPQESGAPVMRREVTLVIDRSGSMRGEKIEQARAAALQIIEALDDGERFNIIDYSDTIERFAPEPVVKDDASIRRVRSYIDNIKAVGGTNIHDALLEAVRPDPVGETLPIILFLTDGLPTVGPTSETVIREAVAAANQHDRRIFSFGVGYDVNAPLLTALSQQSRAAPAFVSPGEDVEVAVGKVFSKLAGPVLALPELKVVNVTPAVGASPIRELMPQNLPDVFAGEQLIVLGQYTSDETMPFQIVGEHRGKPRHFTTEVKPAEASAKNAFIARLWAQRKIATLVDAIRQAGADGQMTEDDPKFKELVDEIVALSQEYGILTEYTAFIAIEDLYKDNLAADGQLQYRYTRGGLEERSGRLGVARERANLSRQMQARVQTLDDGADGEFVLRSTIQPSGGRPSSLAGGDFVPEFEPDAGRIAASLQTVAGRSFYLRGDRWVEAEILEQADEAPDREIAFGTDAYDTMVDELIERGLQAVLSLNSDHDVYLKFGDERILLRRPTE